MKKLLVILISIVCLSSPAFAQQIKDTKMTVNYTAVSKTGLKFQWNSTHKDTDISEALNYKYRTDYTVGLNKSSKFSFFAEGVAKQLSTLSTYDKTRNIGLNYGIEKKNLLLNLKWNQNVTGSPLGLQAQKQESILQLDIVSRF